ncbi:MAG: helix-turn-helix domain-containing protein [Phycisphaeraceae bacterium]
MGRAGIAEITPCLRYANFYDAGAGGGFGPRYIADFQLLFVQAGQGTATVGAQSHALVAGSTVFYGPNERHVVRSSHDDPLRLLGLHFLFRHEDAGRLPQQHTHWRSRRWAFRRGAPRCPISPRPLAVCAVGPPSPLRHYFESLVLSYIADRRRRIEQHGWLHLVLQAWLDAQRAVTSDPPAHHRAAILGVQQAILQNLRQPPTRAALARHAGVSPEYLGRLFKRHTGMSLKAFVNQQRLSMARRLLVEGQLNVGEVGQAVGFDDPFYFSRRFKQAFGVSPRNLRRDHRLA